MSDIQASRAGRIQQAGPREQRAARAWYWQAHAQALHACACQDAVLTSGADGVFRPCAATRAGRSWNPCIIQLAELQRVACALLPPLTTPLALVCSTNMLWAFRKICMDEK